ncbi:hypothetical protein D1007_50529 [Hordeum vulgare]|nr:hypothetical protein D1007_50529 [Hordeum vulgare]
MVSECIDMEIGHFAEGFTQQWVFVDAGKYIPLLLTASSPVAPSSGWDYTPLVDPRLLPMWMRLETLKETGVTNALIVREFLRQRSAPLQHHSRPTWSFFGLNNLMQLYTGANRATRSSACSRF